MSRRQIINIFNIIINKQDHICIHALSHGILSTLPGCDKKKLFTLHCSQYWVTRGSIIYSVIFGSYYLDRLFSLFCILLFIIPRSPPHSPLDHGGAEEPQGAVRGAGGPWLILNHIISQKCCLAKIDHLQCCI